MIYSIDERWRLETDSRSWTLQRYRVPERFRGVEIPEDERQGGWVDTGYYGRLDHALQGYLDKALRMGDYVEGASEGTPADVRGLLEAYRTLYAALERMAETLQKAGVAK